MHLGSESNSKNSGVSVHVIASKAVVLVKDIDGNKFRFMLLSPAGSQHRLTAPRTCSIGPM